MVQIPKSHNLMGLPMCLFLAWFIEGNLHIMRTLERFTAQSEGKE